MSSKKLASGNQPSGGSQLGELVRKIDWAKTPLGPSAQWPPSLKAHVNLCVNSSLPMALTWGSEHTVIYNDANRQVMAQKHPWALGRSARDGWGDSWGLLGPMIAGVLATGQATWSEDMFLPVK